ncbi:MAG: hypothetical protein JST51_10490 [Armatimonadetes bacterium]|nr:hypothetical protein [Armatimonadota bacterium]
MGFPHSFPSLRGEAGFRKPVILIGAGLSLDTVPGPAGLYNEKRDIIESKIGRIDVSHSNKAIEFYQWAEKALILYPNDTKNVPKLGLAQDLGILDDQRWMGIPKSDKHAPRHRVFARFAKEGRMQAVWSLNWDCRLEQAFESFGIDRDAVDKRLPWLNTFKALITEPDLTYAGNERVLIIVKPHGCAHSLQGARNLLNKGDETGARALAQRFLIGWDELSDQTGSGMAEVLGVKFEADVLLYPFHGIGWSASEEYIQKRFENPIAPEKNKALLAIDEFTIVDRTFNGEGHTKITGYFNLSEGDVFVDADESRSGLTTDDIFLYIQAIYALDQLLKQGQFEAQLKNLRDEIVAQPTKAKQFSDFFDFFLPEWVRHCWQQGLCPCKNADGSKWVSVDDILDRPNEHIPWSIAHIARPDLMAAAWLLGYLLENGIFNRFDFKSCPGGFVEGSTLVLPMPHGGTSKPIENRALNSLADSMSEGITYISYVKILRIDLQAPGNDIPSDADPSLDVIKVELGLSTGQDPTNVLIGDLL